MELERKYVTLSKQKGHAVSQVTLEEERFAGIRIRFWLT